MTKQRYSRRDFFRAAAQPTEESALRPPWTSPQTLQNCTGCGDCVSACTESVLKIGADRIPKLDFTETGCTFCGDCAVACPEQVFTAQQDSRRVQVAISDACLLAKKVACQICTDFCDTEALRFDPGQRPVGGLRIDNAACTGCGSCVGACPVDAITLVSGNAEAPA